MCTGIEIISNQGNPYWGRTQDFEQHFEYAGMKIPAGTKIESTYTPFTTEIATMGIAWATDVHAHPVILDGINEQGICGGSFYFDHWYRYASDEEIQTQGKVPLRGEELVTWILTHYRSLDEVKQRLNSEVGIVDAPGPMMGRSVPQHSVFQDESGRSIVVEPSSTNGFAIYENKVGVFANAPTFDWHVTNLKMHLERSTHRHYSYDINEPIKSIELDEWTSGLMGIPSDYKPETRFLRAAYAKLMSLPVDDDSAINEVFQLLTAVNNPKGVLRPVENGQVLVPWTQYTAAYDIRNRVLYAHTYDNRNVRMLEFGNPREWDKVHYFSFISRQTYEPFAEEN